MFSLLNSEQEAKLEAFGIDPASLPTQITPEMERCFVEKLGQERVNAIIQGDSPTVAEFLQVGACL